MESSGISRETLVALHETEGIGWKTIRDLWAARKRHPIRAGMREGDLRECGLLPKQAAALAANLEPSRMEERQYLLGRAGIGVITWADRDYPLLLRRTGDPPPVLYYIGRLELIARPAIAVVGTRIATAYGKHVTELFSAAFADRGFAVISGLAKGIDTCAHKGALNRAGGTVAVLGLPVDRIYPPENRQLYQEIARKGLLLSEAPPGTPYHTGMFPARNRIIAGLSLAVLVAEAPKDSGALITAKDAIEAERPVFVIPGPVTSPRSLGGMAMLQDGTADPALVPEDVVGRFRSHLEDEDEDDNGRQADPADAVNEEEDAVYRLLLEDPRTVDELAADTGFALGMLHSILLSLEIKKKIQRFPGSVYGAL
ncbi:DNA-protecting protein DprA [Cohnella sp. CFH 77786]|uniref:DNA-processing protein DprA n=1 Tax=Cohnella sp. CFH 77786 TaxID=2662265 RepID=UPI001C6085BC|nr:DNA-processing protein DprA [Cohnella sp. CFH 77786]MBW5444587.1 DNA-protecting protein DprA [Cohnella sp. CFH 77786]